MMAALTLEVEEILCRVTRTVCGGGGGGAQGKSPLFCIKIKTPFFIFLGLF